MTSMFNDEDKKLDQQSITITAKYDAPNSQAKQEVETTENDKIKVN